MYRQALVDLTNAQPMTVNKPLKMVQGDRCDHKDCILSINSNYLTCANCGLFLSLVLNFAQE